MLEQCFSSHIVVSLKHQHDSLSRFVLNVLKTLGAQAQFLPWHFLLLADGLYQQPHSVTSHIFLHLDAAIEPSTPVACSSHFLFYVERAKCARPPRPLPPMKLKASQFKKAGPKPYFQLKIVDIEHCSNKVFLCSCGRYIILPNVC